ncbi:MAG: AAA family ATPase [Lachnospiraceae bacterium]|nr:AAA family ATPase [Lachnospiraceae bacterium]
MGIYVNPGNASFQEAINSEIYVDKSGLIAYINGVIRTQQKNLCVSRPRRFGKSMAANMLAAYYSRGCDSSRLFSGLAIEGEESFPMHLNRHNVIRWDVQRFLESKSGYDRFINDIEDMVIRDLKKEFPECGDFPEGSRLKTVLDEVYGQTGQGFVFIIDEWDCVFRMAKKREEMQKAYLDFLRGLFKGAEYVDLAYMTGILPIKKYGEHSALNIFEEYSMLDSAELAMFFGFTEEEVHGLCTSTGMDFQDVERWYDGYLMNGIHIYNPKSVVDATTSQNDMTTFKTKDDVLTLLIHLGYLAYDEDTEEAFIPNQEIAQEYMRAIKVGGWGGLTEALNCSEQLLRSTWALDGEAVAAGMSAIHDETASLLKYNNENSLTCTVLMAYYSTKAYYMNPIMELPSGKGYADVVYLPKRGIGRPALVVELKWNKSARGAIAQIKDRQYAAWIADYTGDILLVGISYDKKSKEHACLIETWRKT